MKKLTITGAMGALCLLLVSSAYSVTLYLANASPFVMTAKVNFAARSSVKHVVERTEESAFLAGTYEVRKDKTIITPSLHAPVDKEFTINPYSTESIEIPQHLFFAEPNTNTITPVMLTITATIPSSSDAKGGIIGASSTKTFRQDKENVLFAVNADYPTFVDGVGRVTVDIFRMAGQDL
ncbi:hypothetical protein JST99_04640 [Candidatus Dependentiae bacterium]|nr:hypothetical protein [Candidatus Dependentiae bacterium]MCC7414661.1 hypothetical protein [Campylobacterota bacterium]